MEERRIHGGPILRPFLAPHPSDEEETLHVNANDSKWSDTTRDTQDSQSQQQQYSMTSENSSGEVQEDPKEDGDIDNQNEETSAQTNDAIDEGREIDETRGTVTTGSTGGTLNSSSKWNKLKSIVKNSSGDSANNKSNSSMTDQELAFLKMRQEYREKNNDTTHDGKDLLESSSTVSFSEVVGAAVARARLRQDLTVRLSRLTMKEAEFLKDLVNDDNVTQRQLEHANYVLNTDPLYRLPGETSSNFEGSITSSVAEAEMSQYSKYKDKVQFDGVNIEIMLDWDGITSSSENLRIASSRSYRDNKDKNPVYGRSSIPSKYSYKTWSVFKDTVYPVLGLPDEEDFDEVAQVLSPPMMASIRKSLPFAVSEDNFWLKYAMNRDGASILSLYNTIRQSTKTLLAIETVNGEVFGAFISSPWRSYQSYYGSCEAFLWRLNKSRFTPTASVEEQIELESDLNVFTWSQENRNIQMSDQNKIVIGGGFPDDDDNDHDSDKWGMGIALGADLYEGTSSNCVTFNSPGLVQSSPKDEVFEVANMEVWAFTPCTNSKDAEQLEMGRMFVLSHFEQM